MKKKINRRGFLKRFGQTIAGGAAISAGAKVKGNDVDVLKVKGDDPMPENPEGGVHIYDDVMPKKNGGCFRAPTNFDFMATSISYQTDSNYGSCRP